MKWLSLVFLLFSIKISYSQDSSFVHASRERLKTLYNDAIGANNTLYRGSQYVMYNPLEKEHPFLFEDWKEGSIRYNEVSYENVQLLYDTYNDQVVIEHFSGAHLQLVKENISAFTIGSRLFVKVNSSKIQDGFYEKLGNSKTKVYAKRKKKFVETLKNTELKREFEEKSTLFINFKGDYFVVKKKNELLKVLQDKKEILVKYIKEQRLKFKDESDFVKTVAYYDQN
jgi:hypothetical protein